MEKEIIETYYYNPSDFNQDGSRKSDGKTFRDYIKECEIILLLIKYNISNIIII